MINKNDELFKKYHIKLHLGIQPHSSTHGPIDLRELFVYKLLQLIAVGPEVYFLHDTHGLTSAIYIATEDGRFIFIF